jgi:flagellar assembly protein FliH
VSQDRRKYLFDLNNFDSNATPEPEEDLPPPPPVYSEEELATAKKESFEEGRITGHQEEQQSRNQYIATQISELNTQILGLFLAEQIREKRFEQEVIHLCRALVGKLFPALTERDGYAEIEQVIANVVSKQPKAIIIIELPTDDVDAIKTHLSTMKDIETDRLTIIGNEDLSKGNCRMKWQDGGATRDHQALSAAIFAELDEVLAPIPQKVQNSESEPKQPESQTEDVKGEQNG